MTGCGEYRLSRLVFDGKALLTLVNVDGELAVPDLVVLDIKPVRQVILHLSDGVLDAYGIAGHLADLHLS